MFDTSISCVADRPQSAVLQSCILCDQEWDWICGLWWIQKCLVRLGLSRNSKPFSQNSSRLSKSTYLPYFCLFVCWLGTSTSRTQGGPSHCMCLVSVFPVWIVGRSLAFYHQEFSLSFSISWEQSNQHVPWTIESTPNRPGLVQHKWGSVRFALELFNNVLQ